MLLRWQAKYLAQKTLQTIPGGFQLNRVFQKLVGNRRKVKIYGIKRVPTMAEALHSCGVSVQGKRVFELGTGYDMSAPMMVLGLGASSISTYDLARHVTPEMVDRARSLIASRNGYEEESAVPFVSRPEWWIERVDANRIDTALIDYRAPADARKTGEPPESYDLYYSLAVLEHIPVAALRDILAESYRLLRPEGYCYHYVQPCMHATSVDPHATSVDFLSISERAWQWFYENNIAHENRLRAPEYGELLEQCGFEVVRAWHTVDLRGLRKLSSMKLAARFRRFTLEELATDYVWIIARKPSRP